LAHRAKHAAIRKPIATADAVVSVKASLGIASAITHANSGSKDRPMSALELLKAADAATYAAKSNGGGGYRVWKPEDQSPEDRTDISFPALV
jgi:GGDEF domain-containing protein